MNIRPPFLTLLPCRGLLSAVAVLAAVTIPAAVQVATASSSYASAGTASLVSGEVLHDGQSLVNGSLTFSMQTDGNFVLYTGSHALWQSGTAGRGGSFVAMQTDGNLVVYDTASHPLWWSGTANHAGAHLQLQSDANAVVYSATGQPLWQTGTAGQGGPPSLVSGEVLHDGQSLVNGSLSFAMQTDGNFVLYAGSHALWQSGTAGRGGSFVAMQTDGNLVVYDTAGHPLWWSGTANHAGAHLQLQGDANAVVYSATGQPLWQTGTAGEGGTAPSGFDAARRAGAIRWEAAHAGSSAYNQLCEKAVENAYGTTGHYGSARIDYNAQLNAGQVHHDPNAPAGALVFFNGDSSFGHVGIAVGDGATYWTTDGTIHVAPYSEGLGYLGWSYAPSSW
jgi:hypothetical protein